MQAPSQHVAAARRLAFKGSATLARVHAAHALLGSDELAHRLGCSRDCVHRLLAAHIELTRAEVELGKASLAGEELDPGIERVAVAACASLAPDEVSRAALAIERGVLDAPPTPKPATPASPREAPFSESHRHVFGHHDHESNPVPPMGRRGR